MQKPRKSSGTGAKQDYKQVVLRLIAALENVRIPYMLVGGLAVNYYGFPRATFDVDVAVLLPEEKVKEFASGLKKQKFVVHEKEVRLIQKLGSQFFVSVPSSPYRVDVFIARKEFERNILERRQKKKIFGRTTYLISAEDLILTKLTLNRAQDSEDARGVIERQKGKLNTRYLKSHARNLGVEDRLKTLL